MNNQSDDMFGTDPKKLARAGDPSTSHAAARGVNTARWEERVLDIIKGFRERGCTQDEVIDAIHYKFGSVPYSTITARFKALQDKELITYKSKKRKGKSGRLSRVRVATEFFGKRNA
jgi:hypothetical protein